MTYLATVPLPIAPVGSPGLLAIGALLLAVALLLAGWLLRRGRVRTGSKRRPGTPAVRVAALAAAGCTAYSADTSWRFAADYLDMGSTAERAAMFAAAELALFATALMARQNLNSPRGTPGLPGVLVWVITGVQAIPAFAESGPVGGTVRAFVGPIMAAMLWHQAMGIELRLHMPEAASHGVLASAGREVRERLLSRIGIAERNRDAAQITRDRATVRAVALATRLADRTPKRRGNWRGGGSRVGCPWPSREPRWAPTLSSGTHSSFSSPHVGMPQHWQPSICPRPGRSSSRMRRPTAPTRPPHILPSPASRQVRTKPPTDSAPSPPPVPKRTARRSGTVPTGTTRDRPS